MFPIIGRTVAARWAAITERSRICDKGLVHPGHAFDTAPLRTTY
jgi:hypothetical protein